MNNKFLNDVGLEQFIVYKEDGIRCYKLYINQIDSVRAIAIADLYKKCWNIESFFKTMK